MNKKEARQNLNSQYSKKIKIKWIVTNRHSLPFSNSKLSTKIQILVYSYFIEKFSFWSILLSFFLLVLYSCSGVVAGMTETDITADTIRNCCLGGLAGYIIFKILKHVYANEVLELIAVETLTEYGKKKEKNNHLSR